jgi:hypothetical protein
MFESLEKKLGLAVDFPAFLEKMSSILKLDNVAEKTEQLLSFRKTLHDEEKKATKALAKLVWRSISATVAVASAIVIFSTAVTIVTVAPWVIAVVLGIAGAAVPGQNEDRFDTIHNKINKEITTLADSHPQEVINSPKFQQSIKASFNYAADVESDFAKLTADVAQKKTAAPKK